MSGFFHFKAPRLLSRGLFLGNRMTQEIESIGLGMDTSGIEKGIKALDVLAGKGAPVERAMAQVEGAAKKTVKSLDDLANATPKAVDSVGKTATKAADGLAKVSGAADGAVKSVRNIGANTAGLDKLSSSSAASAINIKSLGAAAVASEKGVQQFVRSVSSVAQSIAAEAASMNDARAAAAAYSAQHIAAAKATVPVPRCLFCCTLVGLPELSSAHHPKQLLASLDFLFDLAVAPALYVAVLGLLFTQACDGDLLHSFC